MTGSDNATRGPDRPFSHPGVGMRMTFRCAACCNVRSCVGRKFQRVMGLRQYVCAKCAEVRASACVGRTK